MVLVYTHKITPRLSYIIKHFFVRLFNVKVSITTEVSEFIAHNGPKMSYTRKQLGNELFIKCNELLFEQGINDVEVNMSHWEGVPVFFQNK